MVNIHARQLVMNIVGEENENCGIGKKTLRWGATQKLAVRFKNKKGKNDICMLMYVSRHLDRGRFCLKLVPKTYISDPNLKVIRLFLKNH